MVASHGGVFLAIGTRMRGFVIAKGILPSGKACWAHLDHPKLGRIGVLAVYALMSHTIEPDSGRRLLIVWTKVVCGYWVEILIWLRILLTEKVDLVGW